MSPEVNCVYYIENGVKIQTIGSKIVVLDIAGTGAIKICYNFNQMDKKFGGVIWTNHVLERLKERGLTQSDVWAVWRRPDSARYGQTKGAWVYFRKFGNQKIEVVAKQNERKEWVILSVWSQTIENYHPKRDHSPFWLKTLKFLFRV